MTLLHVVNPSLHVALCQHLLDLSAPCLFRKSCAMSSSLSKSPGPADILAVSCMSLHVCSMWRVSPGSLPVSCPSVDVHAIPYVDISAMSHTPLITLGSTCVSWFTVSEPCGSLSALELTFMLLITDLCVHSYHSCNNGTHMGNPSQNGHPVNNCSTHHFPVKMISLYLCCDTGDWLKILAIDVLSPNFFFRGSAKYFITANGFYQTMLTCLSSYCPIVFSFPRPCPPPLNAFKSAETSPMSISATCRFFSFHLICCFAVSIPSQECHNCQWLQYFLWYSQIPLNCLGHNSVYGILQTLTLLLAHCNGLSSRCDWQFKHAIA